ncbi:MAG: hypothetical protein V7L21_29070 [Nostoc sp.]|nr:hypothetical protein [Nostoc sp. NMS9]MBN3941186.1 hypothetical protein [Nostoc sp. NMS9]
MLNKLLSIFTGLVICPTLRVRPWRSRRVAAGASMSFVICLQLLSID